MIANICGIFRNKKIVFIGLWIISLALFVFYGSKQYVFDKDTIVYSIMTPNSAVMPVYQLFLLLMRSLFRNEYLFTIIVIIQGLLASISLMVFVSYIAKICELDAIAILVIYFLGTIPFLFNFPAYITSQSILTEGISIPVTYLLIVMLLKSLVEDDFRFIFVSFIISIFLYLTRSQLLISIPLVSLVMTWMILRRKGVSLRNVIMAFSLCFISIVGIVLLVLILFSGYTTYLAPKLFEIDASIEKPAYEPELNQMINDKFGNGDGNENNNVNEGERIRITGQFNTLILIRGFFIAEDDDIELFEGSDRVLFSKIMGKLHEENVLWCDMEKTLFIPWTGMVQDKISSLVVNCVDEKYYETNGLSQIINMSIRIMIHNFGDLLVVFLRLWFPALMAATFIQNPSYYFWCIIITFFINIVICTCLFLRKNRKGNADTLLRFSYLATLVYTLLVSAVHIPLQRYLIYFQGVLYVSIFIMMREIFLKTRGQNLKHEVEL